MVKNTRNYVLFSNVSDIKITDLTLSEKKNNARELECGDALYITDKGVSRIKTPRV